MRTYRLSSCILHKVGFIMAKHNYFDILERLSDIAYNAVNTACSDKYAEKTESFEVLRSELNSTVLDLEKSLFGDFLPPLERNNIAEYAHSLSDIVTSASEYITIRHKLCCPAQRFDEPRFCISLANELKEATFILRKIKKSGQMPDLKRFRECLRAAEEAHSADLSKLQASILPKAYETIINYAGNLRSELSATFDTLIEIMLNNI